MTNIANFLPYIQIILSVILTVGILLQHSSAGAGGAFGGGDAGGLHHTRRGFDKFIFRTTIIVAVLFAISAFVALLIG